MKLDHIGIAVQNLDSALKIYSCALGFTLKEILNLIDQGMKIAVMTSDNVEFELIEPLKENTPVGKFLKKRGNGIHHICFSVPQIETAIKDLEKKGLSLVAPPRLGVKGKKVAFFHPKSTMGVLIEICEEAEG